MEDRSRYVAAEDMGHLRSMDEIPEDRRGKHSVHWKLDGQDAPVVGKFLQSVQG